MNSIELQIITAERVVYSDSVEAVVAPGIEGELGILPHHSALMTNLKAGPLMIRKDGEESFFAVTGGFLEVMDNRVTILSDAAEHSQEIDESRAQLAMERASERLENREGNLDLERALAQLKRAQIRVAVSRLRKMRRANRGL
ncbi:F0F1 ATP synthase subunit epsilon [SAR202 cluster bacterium AC-409-J13_OGT_754m]|nr:F0F1 ATP synthase subunit epsilon [SAR202 cluster bacterium AC-409-J13_OGT_754m]